MPRALPFSRKKEMGFKMTPSKWYKDLRMSPAIPMTLLHRPSINRIFHAKY